MTDGLLPLGAGVAAALGVSPALDTVRRLVSRARARRTGRRHARGSPVQWGQALLFLSGAMRSGATLDEAFRLLSVHAPQALRERIRASGWDAALSPRARVERVMAGPDTAFARAALLLFLESGGRIGRVLETAAATLQARGESEERVRALTAQARASAWTVGLSPFALGVLLGFLSPDLMGGMLRSPLGRLLLTGASGLSLLGLWGAIRLARVET